MSPARHAVAQGSALFFTVLLVLFLFVLPSAALPDDVDPPTDCSVCHTTGGQQTDPTGSCIDCHNFQGEIDVDVREQVCSDCHDTTPPPLPEMPKVVCYECHNDYEKGEPQVQLGQEIFRDSGLSTPIGQSCASCHSADTGFTGPDSQVNLGGAVYEGAVEGRFGNRKAPTVAYAGMSPILGFSEETGVWTGGMFWDGRATGWSSEDPLADQAMGPFLNPVEMANPDVMAVCLKVKNSRYADLFMATWDMSTINCDTKANVIYEDIAASLAAYERSSVVSSYTSKYDRYIRGEGTLTAQELAGLELFNDKAGCSACHPSEPAPYDEATCSACHPAPPPGTDQPPLFTDYSYDNLGIPRNEENPFYGMTEYNPEGAAWRDKGLGGFLASLPTVKSGSSVASTGESPAENMGKMKVPTLRNVDLRPSAGFIKAYGHNGYFKSLEEIVHFYNTRDVGDWPAPEIPDNVNTEELGDLGLTAEEEAAVVAFLRTLSDEIEIPRIALQKATAEKVYSGGTEVTYRFEVTNPGTLPLSAVTIVDDGCGHHPGFVSGDTNGNDLLDPEENWIFSCTLEPEWAPDTILENTAMATGEYMGQMVRAGDVYTLTPYTILKDVKDYSGDDMPWTGSFTVKISVKNPSTGKFDPVKTLSISEGSPIRLWLSEGTYRIEEVDLPKGVVAPSPVTVQVTASSDPGSTTLVNRVWYGCSPGYWKNHVTQWPAGYQSTQKVSSYFAKATPYDTKNLLQALNFQGGSTTNGAKETLLRAATAGLLNEAQFGPDYPTYNTIGEFRTAVSTALSKDRATMLRLATTIDGWNNGYCPLP